MRKPPVRTVFVLVSGVLDHPAAESELVFSLPAPQGQAVIVSEPGTQAPGCGCHVQRMIKTFKSS
ncbi:MAG: hypothetical protein ACLTJB_00010 [Holdemania filiformis]